MTALLMAFLIGVAQLPTQALRCQEIRHVTLCFGDGIILRCVKVGDLKHCEQL